MKAGPRTLAIYMLIAGLLAIGLRLAGCGTTNTHTPLPPTLTPTEPPRRPTQRAANDRDSARFSSSFRGSSLVPSKQRYLVPPQAGNASR